MVSSTHKGWHFDRANGRLQAVYNGTEVFSFDANDMDINPGLTLASFTAGNGTITSDLTVKDDLLVGEVGSSGHGIQFIGSTSGTVTLQVAAAAGTWTMTLPPDDGDAGEQLQTDGNGVTTWEAAGSLREVKDILGRVNPAEALQKLVQAPVYTFRYKEGARPTTNDHETVYTGVVADELPEVMHHNGRIFSPVSAFGLAVGAIQALTAKVDALEAKLAAQGA